MSYPPCRSCGQQTTFPASRIAWHSWICSHCANQARDSSPERYLARKFAEYLRHRGISAPYPGVAFVRQVLAQNNNNNEDDEEWDAQRWRIIVKDETLLKDCGAHLVDNAALVLARGQKRKAIANEEE